MKTFRLFREPAPGGEYLGTIELADDPIVGELLVSGEMTWAILEVLPSEDGGPDAILVRLLLESDSGF